MTERSDISVLTISQYGSDLAQGSAYSGALLRQKDYASFVTQYVVLVPSVATEDEHTHGEGLRIVPLRSRGTIDFLRKAYTTSIQLHAQYHFDVVMVDNPHVGGILGVLLRWRLGIPLVVHSMADVIYNPWYRRERLSNRIKDCMTRCVIAWVDILRVSTQYEYERITSYGFDMKKISVIPFYVDEVAFTTRLEETTVEKIPNSLLFVGRLSYQKDLATLIRAMKTVLLRTSDARLRIVGSGSEESTYRALASSIGVSGSIDFLGAVPYASVPAEFKQASVFVLSSLYEGTCMVLHEAALACLPIVSTDVAGAHDFIRNGVEGQLVPVRDDVALGNAIADILANRAQVVAMGQKSNSRVAAFSREKALAAWQELCITVNDMKKARVKLL